MRDRQRRCHGRAERQDRGRLRAGPRRRFGRPGVALSPASVRASASGLVSFTYRVSTNANAAAASLGTVRLVDRKGRAASAVAQVTFAAGATVARVRTRLNRATRRRLARSRAGRLALVAQRTYREAGAPPGYALWHTPLTVRRAR